MAAPAWAGATVRVIVRAPGTDTDPPLVGVGEVLLDQPGANPIRFEVMTVPSGSIRVHVDRETLTAAGGATVRLGESRETTLIAKLAEVATFAHVEAGSHEVRIEWNRGEREPTVRTVEVTAGERADVDIGADEAGGP